MKQYGYIECRMEWDKAGNPAGVIWTWVGPHIARVSVLAISSGLPEIRIIDDDLIQIGPFRTRIVDRERFSADDEVLMMQDGWRAVLVQRWFTLTSRIRHAYYHFLAWLKHHGHMATKEGERLSWQHFRLRYRPWPPKRIVDPNDPVLKALFGDEDK